MGTTTVGDETILSQPILPATRCGIVGSGTREDEEDEEEEIERDKPGEVGDEHGDDDEEGEEEEDEGGADYSLSYVPSGDSSRAVPGALGEP
jgi:hypothetical protein